MIHLWCLSSLSIIYKCYRNAKGQSRKDNLEGQLTLNTRHRTKTNNNKKTTKQETRTKSNTVLTKQPLNELRCSRRVSSSSFMWNPPCYSHSNSLLGIVCIATSLLAIIHKAFVLLDLQISVLCFVDRCLSFCLFFFWPWCCLSFDLRFRITTLVSSNFYYYNVVSSAPRQLNVCS